MLQLLHPGRYTRAVLLSLGLQGCSPCGRECLVVWCAAAVLATFVVLLVLLPVGLLKWRVDYQCYGGTIMLLSIVLTTQGLHTIEHLVQWVQYHLLYWPMRQSSGLLSPANSDGLICLATWLVVLVVLALVLGGMRNFWAYLLLAVAVAHTVEHSYLFVCYWRCSVIW